MHTEPQSPILSPTQIGQGDGVYISTYGCQMNDNDSERMMTLLEMMGFCSVTSPDQASLIIINSCSIREKPVHKVHSEAGRYRKLKELNPRLKIGIAGCVASQEKDQLRKDVPVIDFVIGTDMIDQLPDVVTKLRSGAADKIVRAKFDHESPYHIETLVRNPGVSTFVNITKGCDNFCTFCVVPFTRGRERSRPMSHLLSDIQKLTDRGVKEITLLGQNVNSYKSDCGAGFNELLRQVAEKTAVERIRFTTSHPKDFNDELIDVMAEHREKVMDYIHLPVQSGNSDLLERMNRGYTREDYLRRVERIFAKIPGVALSTDIITGFPGETDAQFEDTMSLLEEVPYESLFAFAYSSRPMTKAAKYTDQVPEEVRSERLNRLLARHREIATALAKAYEGRTVQVLVEKHDAEKNILSGRSTQNKMTFFEGSAGLVGKTVAVKITESLPFILRGNLLQ